MLWAVPLLAVTGGAIALVSRLEPSRRRRLLVVGAATLGLASTSVLVVLGARQGTARDPVALAPPPDAGGTTRDLAAVTNAEMEAVIAQNPAIVGMRLALVERYLADGDIEDAYRHSSIAIDLPATDQEYERALRLHGWLTALQGAPASGEQYLRAALTLSPTDRDALWFLANVEFTGLNNPAAARIALDQLLATPMEDAQRAPIDALAAKVDAAIAAGPDTSAPATAETAAP